MKRYFVSVLLFNCFLFIYAQTLTNVRVERIAEGFQFVEGPVWIDGLGLLFSDIPAGTVYLWNEQDGVSPYIQPSGNSNGLALDHDGNLLLAQHGPRQVGMFVEDSIIALATHYNGARFNSPNDLAVHSDGSVFFTDPPYGLNDQGGVSELGYNGIFRLKRNGEVQLLDNSLNRPNGIAFSPDESSLYVNDSEARRIYVWDVVDDSTITGKREFAYMSPFGYADGMKVDPEGYLYSTGPGGIWIFSPAGDHVKTISVPGQTTNCAWGNEDRKTLYVTSGGAVYRTYNDTEQPNGLRNGPGSRFNVVTYPNPFSEKTEIVINLQKTSQLQIDIFDGNSRSVSSSENNFYLQGIHNFYWQAADKPSGIYFLMITVENKEQVIIALNKI